MGKNRQKVITRTFQIDGNFYRLEILPNAEVIFSKSAPDEQDEIFTDFEGDGFTTLLTGNSRNAWKVLNTCINELIQLLLEYRVKSFRVICYDEKQAVVWAKLSQRTIFKRRLNYRLIQSDGFLIFFTIASQAHASH